MDEKGKNRKHYIDLMRGIAAGSQVWMSHGDTIEVLPEGYHTICSTANVKYAGYQIDGEQT